MRAGFIHIGLFLLLAHFICIGNSRFRDNCYVDNCAICQRSRHICEKCYHYYYYANNTCQLCYKILNGCNKCSQSAINGTVTCRQCYQGTFLANNSCHQCSSVIKNCDTCQLSNNNILNCTKCWRSSAMISNNTCLSCEELQIPNCVACRYDTQNQTLVCAECEDHLADNDWDSDPDNQQLILVDNRCLPCSDVIPYCIWCVNTHDDGMTCTNCGGYMIYKKKTCIKPIYHCRSGPYFGDDCVLCQVQKCATCIRQPQSQAIICHTCQWQHYYQKSNNSCIRCPVDQCYTCEKDNQDQVQCTKCGFPSYYKERYCFRCEIQNCYQCQYTTTGIECSWCYQGYKPKNHTCIECYSDLTPQSTQSEIYDTLEINNCRNPPPQIQARLGVYI